MNRNIITRITIIAFMFSLISGCSHYIAPNMGVDMKLFFDESQYEWPDSNTLSLTLKPKASVPARIAIARVQSPGYHEYAAKSFGQGNYSIVTVRDIEEDSDIEAMQKLDDIEGLFYLNRMMLGSQKLDTDRELRVAAARMGAEWLLIYTVETDYLSEDMSKPLSVISLGISPTVVVNMDCSVPAILMDTQTGYVYSAMEGTARHKQLCAWWTNQSAIDQSRRQAEREAFKDLVTQFKSSWPQIVTGRKLVSTEISLNQ